MDNQVPADTHKSTTIFSKHLQPAIDDIGVGSLVRLPHDVKLLFIQSFIRQLAHGATTLVLVSYLASLGFSDGRIGLFLTLTILGSIIVEHVSTLACHTIGRRFVLVVGALLMSVGGIIFASSNSYWTLLVAAVLGMITPIGVDVGPFQAIEESSITLLSAPQHQSRLSGWYRFSNGVGTAFGLLGGGLVMQSYVDDPIASYRRVFTCYAALGVVNMIIAAFLSGDCELQPEMEEAGDEERPLLSDDTTQTRQSPNRLYANGPIILLTCLFALNTFGTNLAPQTWITNFFARKFGMAPSKLGTLFFTTSLISTLSAPLLRRVLQTESAALSMHIPSHFALSLLGIPTTLPLSIILLFISRVGSGSMETLKPSMYLAPERKMLRSIVYVVQIAAKCLGPYATGVLAQGDDTFWNAFLIAGGMKIMYDLTLLFLLANRPHANGARDVGQDEDDDGR